MVDPYRFFTFHPPGAAHRRFRIGTGGANGILRNLPFAAAHKVFSVYSVFIRFIPFLPRLYFVKTPTYASDKSDRDVLSYAVIFANFSVPLSSVNFQSAQSPVPISVS